MTDIWSRITSVSTEDVEQHIASLLPILRMTRDTSKFPKWNSATVDKAFKWAKSTAKNIAPADEVQRRTILEKGNVIRDTGIRFLDEEPILLLIDPVFVLVRAIISSPLLTWVENAENLLLCTLAHSKSILGEDATIALTSSVLKGNLGERIATMRLQRFANNAHSQPQAFSASFSGLPEPGLDEVSLAVHLLATMAACNNNNNNNNKNGGGGDDDVISNEIASSDININAPYVQKLLALVHEDNQSLRLLCVAATLSSARIACSLTAYNSRPQSETRIHSDSDSDSGVKPSWQEVSAECRSPWVYEGIARCVLGADEGGQGQGLRRYLEIDPDGSLCVRMCKKDESGRFTSMFHAQLRATFGVGTPSVQSMQMELTVSEFGSVPSLSSVCIGMKMPPLPLVPLCKLTEAFLSHVCSDDELEGLLEVEKSLNDDPLLA